MSTGTTGGDNFASDVAAVANPIGLNTNTATKVLDANPDREFIHINNNSNNDIWLRLMPAADEPGVKKGILLESKGNGKVYFEMRSGTMYTGEISAIADNGNPSICSTEM